jgi:hypothetical protein
MLHRMSHPIRWTRRILTVALGVLAVAWPAVALAAAPPTPALRRSSPVWLGYAVMFLLALVVLAISLMPSKRGHQD